jgi:hypothetical protein
MNKYHRVIEILRASQVPLPTHQRFARNANPRAQRFFKRPTIT